MVNDRGFHSFLHHQPFLRVEILRVDRLDWDGRGIWLAHELVQVDSETGERVAHPSCRVGELRALPFQPGLAPPPVQSAWRGAPP